MQIQSGGDLDQFDPRGSELEDTAFGDVQHLLATFGGVAAVEGQMLDLSDKLDDLGFVRAGLQTLIRNS